MKICIWCSKSEPNASFKERAHTVPNSLGGKNICDSVCDDCNSIFGDPTSKGPSVEIVLKEAFNLSRYVLDWHSKRRLSKFKSQYFNINFGTNEPLRLRSTFKTRSQFLEKLGRQLRRGIFKMFLEERMRVKNDALDARFDFIRQFARYDLNDLPVYFFVPIHQIILTTDDAIKNPSLIFNEDSEQVMNEYGFYHFNFIGHILAIPVSNLYAMTLASYQKYFFKKMNIYSSMEQIVKFNDLDLLFVRTLA